MFSSTTIASSITMPTESVSASMVIRLSVKPMYQIKPNVAMIEVGIAIAAMIVERRLFRNRSTTSAARMEPTIRCSSTLSMAASMNSEVSRTSRRSYPAGSVVLTSSSRRFTSVTTSTVFVPDWRRTWSRTVPLPFRFAIVSGSASPSSTRATSEMRTGWPSFSRTTMSLNSATVWTRPRVRSVTD